LEDEVGKIFTLDLIVIIERYTKTTVIKITKIHVKCYLEQV